MKFFTDVIVSETSGIGSFSAEVGVKAPNHCWKRSRRNWTHDLVSTCVDLTAPAPPPAEVVKEEEGSDKERVGPVGGCEVSGNIVNTADETEVRGVGLFEESTGASPADGLGDLGSGPAAPGRTGGKAST